jgi:hypothetical protein
MQSLSLCLFHRPRDSLQPIISSVGFWRRTRSVRDHHGVAVSSRKSESALASRLLEICPDISISQVSGVCFFRTSSRVPIRRAPVSPWSRLLLARFLFINGTPEHTNAGFSCFVFRSGFFMANTCMRLCVDDFLVVRVQVDSLPVRAYSQVICLPRKNRNDSSCCRVRWTC